MTCVTGDYAMETPTKHAMDRFTMYNSFIRILYISCTYKRNFNVYVNKDDQRPVEV